MMGKRCPRCGAAAIKPQPMRICNKTITPSEEWECGSWVYDGDYSHPVNTCGIAERDAQIKRLQAVADAAMEFVEIDRKYRSAARKERCPERRTATVKLSSAVNALRKLETEKTENEV